MSQEQSYGPVDGGVPVGGPGLSTDHAVARWDGTTGDLLEDSVVIVSDAGVVTGVTGLTVTGATTLATTGASVNTFGNTTGATSISEYVGTGNYLLDGAPTSNLTFGTSLTTGLITVGGTAQTGTITVGQSSGVDTINVGGGAGGSVVTVGNAANANLSITTASTTIAVNGGGGSVNIGTDNSVNTVQIGPSVGGTVDIYGQAIQIGIGTVDAITIGVTNQSGIITIGDSGATGVLNLKAGGGINLVGAQNISVAATVTHALTGYTASATDYVVPTDSSAGVVNVNLPAFPATGRRIIVVDATGAAASHTVTVTGNGHNISAKGTSAATKTLISNYTGIDLIFNGTIWNAIELDNILTTQFDVLVGGANNTIASVGPGTAGQVLQSGGNAANPAYSTATYPATAGGTGTILRANGTNWVATTATYPTTTTINQLLYSSAANVVGGLTTANNGVVTTGTTGIPVVTALGTDGQVIIGSSAGAPAAATLTAGTGITITNGNNSISIAATGSAGIGSVTSQTFTATGPFTYTPTAGTKFAIVELVGGGGGSGGLAGGANGIMATGGGGAGAYARFILTSAQVGASLTGSVGVAGSAGTAGNNAGGNGGNTTLATSSSWTAAGGTGSSGAANVGAATATTLTGGAGGAVTTGTGTLLDGSSGQTGFNGLTIPLTGGSSSAGTGGSSQLGRGGIGFASPSTNGVGSVGVGYGSGGGGSANFLVNATTAGAAGTAGIAIFTEYQ